MSRRVTRRRWIRWPSSHGAVLVLAASAATLVAAAPAAASGNTADLLAVDSSTHPQVTLTVEPPDQLAGVDLPASAFTLTEDGERMALTVERTTDAQRAPREALEVVLVIDTSGSMQGAPLEAAKSAGAAFLAAMPAGTRVGVVAFGSEPSLVQALTDEVAAASASLDGLTATGETALYDGLGLGVAQFASTEGTRRALVVLSDGGDTASTATLDEATKALAAAGAEFVAVELVTPEYNGEALRSLASGSSGTVLSADDPAQLTSLYGDVAADLLNRYALTYTSRAGGDTEIAIAVAWAGTVSRTSRSVRLPEGGAGAVAAPDETVVSNPGWVGSPAALYTGLALLGGLFLLLLVPAVLRPRERHVRLSDRFGLSQARHRLPAISDLAERATGVAQRQLERRGRESKLYATLERAGVNLRPGEFVVIHVLACITTLGLGWLLGGVLVGLAGLASVAAAGPAFLWVRSTRRSNAFAEQLADTLQLITGNLRAGHAVLQAMDSVAGDAPSPTREEFQRLVVEVRLGRDLPDALRAMHQRIGNEDFEWFVQALQIHREVGGDLAEILDTVAETIRERGRLRRHVQALSAEGRLSAIILYVLPFAVGVLFSFLNPEYMTELFGTSLGKAMLMGAAVFMTGGFFWLRRVIRLDF